MKNPYLEKQLYEFIKQDKTVFDFLSKNIGGGICVCNLEKKDEKWINDSLLSILGYNSNTHVSWQDLVHPNDASIVNTLYKAAPNLVTLDIPKSIRLKHTDDTFIEFNFTSKLLASDLIPSKLILLNFEINILLDEIKKIKKTVKTQQFKYEQLFKSMQEGVYIHELIYNDKGEPIDYLISDANPISEHHLKVPVESAKGKKATELYQTTEAPFLQEYYSAVINNTPFVTTIYFPPLEKWFNISAIKTAENEFATVFTDITNEKNNIEKLEEALSTNLVLEERHLFLFNNMSQGVVYHDSTGQVIYANNSASHILGLSLNQLKGKTSLDPRWKSIKEDGSEFPGNEHPVIQTIRTGKAVKNCIMGIFNPETDSHNWININSVPKYKDENKEILEVLVTFEDITEIRTAKAQAEKSDKLKSAFLSNMSHEIRTPLNAIMGFSYLLNDNSINNEAKSKYLNFISTSGKRLLTLINDIIDISKIDAEEIMINYKYYNINVIIDEIEAQYQIQNLNPDVIITSLKAIPNSDYIIKTDKVRLQQLFTNLIDNALKFTKEGTITFGYEVRDAKLLLFVKDTGIGISPEEQELIFERFSQLNNEQIDLHKGTGLGLAIVKGLTDLMKGEVCLESSLNKGTEFYISLPLEVEIEKQSEQENDIVLLNNTKHKTVLIVDDEEPNYIFLHALLHKYNFKTLYARNGKEAIEIANKQQLDAILMDIKMPILNGIDASKIISENQPELPIIFQTAYAITDELEALTKLNYSYITKPIQPQELFSIMDKIFK